MSGWMQIIKSQRLKSTKMFCGWTPKPSYKAKLFSLTAPKWWFLKEALTHCQTIYIPLQALHQVLWIISIIGLLLKYINRKEDVLKWYIVMYKKRKAVGKYFFHFFQIWLIKTNTELFCDVFTFSWTGRRLLYNWPSRHFHQNLILYNTGGRIIVSVK